MNTEDHKIEHSQQSEQIFSAYNLSSNHLHEETEDKLHSQNQTIEDIRFNNKNKIYLKFNKKTSQNFELQSGGDSPKKQQEVLKQIIVPTKKRYTKCMVFLFILFLVSIITIGLTFGILSLVNMKKQKYIEKCKPSYYELNGACTYYDATLFSLDDINQSLPGQEENVLTVIKKQNNLETYEYTIKNIQTTQNLEDGTETEQSNTEVHNIGFLTTEITDTTFSVICMLFNTTLFDQNDQPQFIDGYPGTELLPALLEWKGDGEFPQKTSSHKQDSNFEQIEQELLDSMSNWQVQDSEDLGVSKEDYFVSQIPVIFLEISKSGELLDIQFPANLRKSFKQMLPFVLEQYSPLLNKEIYSQVTADGSGTRRILQDTGALNQKQNQFGSYSQNNTIHFPDSETSSTVGQLEKTYDQSTSAQGGEAIQQEQSLFQQSEIVGGQLTAVKTSAQMNVSNPPMDELEDNSTEEGVQRGQNVQETQNLMGDINVNQETDFVLLQNRKISTNSTEIISDAQEGSITRSMSLEEYEVHINEEIEYDNIQDQLKFQEMDIDTIVGEENSDVRRVLEELGKSIVAPIQFRLFQFNILGMKIKQEMVFQCFEGQTKDECQLKPTLHYGSKNLPLQTLKVQIEISKIVRQLNWFKQTIFDKAVAIANTIEEELGEIIDNTDTIIEEVLEFLDPETNVVIIPFEVFLDEFQGTIDGTYDKLVNLINSSVETTASKFSQYIESITSKVENLVNEILQQVQHAWNNLEGSLIINLDELDALIESDQYPQLPEQLCEAIDTANDQFQEFSEIQNYASIDFIQKQLDKVLHEPMNTLLKKFPALTEIIDSQNEQIQQLSGILLNIANSLISSVIIEPINNLLEEQAGFQHISHILQSQIANVTQAISLKLSALQNKCNQKSSTSVQFSDETLDEFSRLINIGDFLALPIFGDSEEGSNIVSFLTEDLLQTMETEYQNQLEEIMSLYETLKNFSSSLTEIFTSGVEDIKNNVKNLTDDVKSGVFDTKDTIVNASLEIVQSSKDLIADIKNTINSKNEVDDQQLEIEFDILEIIDQVNSILELRHLVDDVTRTFSKLKKVPENFEKMAKYFENLVTKPEEIINFQKIDLKRIIFFNEEDISMLFNDMFSNANFELDEIHFSEVEVKVESETLSSLQSDVGDINTDLIASMGEGLFDEAVNLDGLFQDSLSSILNLIQVSNTTLYSDSLYDYNYRYTYSYQSPIKVSFDILFDFNATANADVSYSIEDSTVKLNCGLDGKVEGQAQGGITVLMAKLVAYVKAVLFDGSIKLNLALGFTNKLFGRALSELYLKALEVTAGIGVNWVVLRIEWYCVDLYFFDLCIPIPILEFGEIQDLIPPYHFSGFEKNFVLFDLQI